MNIDPTDPKYILWRHFTDEHDLILLDTDLREIIDLAVKCVENESETETETETQKS